MPKQSRQYGAPLASALLEGEPVRKSLKQFAQSLRPVIRSKSRSKG